MGGFIHMAAPEDFLLPVVRVLSGLKCSSPVNLGNAVEAGDFPHVTGCLETPGGVRFAAKKVSAVLRQ